MTIWTLLAQSNISVIKLFFDPINGMGSESCFQGLQSATGINICIFGPILDLS